MVSGPTRTVNLFLHCPRIAGHEYGNAMHGAPAYFSNRLLCAAVLVQNFRDAFTTEVLCPLQRRCLKFGIADGYISAVI